MKLFRTEDFISIENPTPGKPYRLEILTAEGKAQDLGGILGLLPPGIPGTLHYHKRRESILFIISGEGVELVDDKETPIRAGDILFIPPGEKHTVLNRSDKEIRYLEFFTYPPVAADFVAVE
jgi:mannose-6-phosphate isomerase-like protein (cupin superfamily)